jgi:hypothetical protein
MGYKNVQSMAGGFKAWKAAEWPTTERQTRCVSFSFAAAVLSRTKINVCVKGRGDSIRAFGLAPCAAACHFVRFSDIGFELFRAFFCLLIQFTEDGFL